MHIPRRPNLHLLAAGKLEEFRELTKDVPRQPEVLVGDEGAVEVARHPDIDAVVTGIVGERPCLTRCHHSTCRTGGGNDSTGVHGASPMRPASVAACKVEVDTVSFVHRVNIAHDVVSRSLDDSTAPAWTLEV